MVLDSGDGASHSVPVYEGYSLPHAVQRFPLAGLDVTLHLTKVPPMLASGVCSFMVHGLFLLLIVYIEAIYLLILC